MNDIILSFAIIAVAGAVAVMVHRIRNDRFPVWAVWVTTSLCVVGWLFMLLTDWPLERLDGFWSEHSVLASSISSILLVGVVFLLYERSEKARQAKLEDGISGAGAGGMVDHLVDLEVALSLLSVPVTPGEYAPDHWTAWDAPNKPLKWLREGRLEILGGHGDQSLVPPDPRGLSTPSDVISVPWGAELIDQCIRRLLAAMRDWNSLLGSSTKGIHALLALSQVRTDLMKLHDNYQDASEPAVSDSLIELRTRLRILAIYFEEWSGAPGPRDEVLSDARSLASAEVGVRGMFAGADRSLRHQLLKRASQMGFSERLDSVDRVKQFAQVAHAGQVDKLGRDYFGHHLQPIAAKLADRGPLAEMAGLLHDVLEDSWVTAADLRGLGVPVEVVAAVEAVTKRIGESYDELIERAAADPLGVWVKLADNELNLESNADLAAVDPLTAERLRTKYEAARKTLVVAAEAHR